MTPEKMKAAFAAAAERVHSSLGPPSMGVQPMRMDPKATNPSTMEVARHVLWMCREGPELLDQGRFAKANRWLGFVQSALWTTLGASIEELKNTNRPDEGTQPALTDMVGDHLGGLIEELALSNDGYLGLVHQLDENVSMTERLYAPNPIDPAVLEKCLETAKTLERHARLRNGPHVQARVVEAAAQLVQRIERMMRPEAP